MYQKECVHKAVFPLELIEFFGTLVLGVLIALANAAGIGGGEIIVPIIMIFFMFSAKEAAALSSFCIFTGSIVRFILNYKTKHPLKNATTIDYGIVMIMLPMVLCGTIIGVQANQVLPDLVLLVGLTLMLIVLSVKSIITSIKVRRRENIQIADEKKAEENSSSLDKGKSTTKISSAMKLSKVSSFKGISNKTKKELKDDSAFDFYHKENGLGEIKENQEEHDVRSAPNHDDRSVSMHHSEDEENEGGSEENEGGSQDVENKKEITMKKLHEVDSNSNSDSGKGSGDSCEIHSEEEKGSVSKQMEDDELDSPLNVILKREASHLKPSSLLLIPCLFGIVILLSLVRGNSNMDSIVGIKSCSPTYFSVLVLLVLLMAGGTAINIFLVKKEYKTKRDNGYKFVEGDLKWESNLIFKFVSAAF